MKAYLSIIFLPLNRPTKMTAEISAILTPPLTDQTLRTQIK